MICLLIVARPQLKERDLAAWDDLLNERNLILEERAPPKVPPKPAALKGKPITPAVPAKKVGVTGKGKPAPSVVTPVSPGRAPNYKPSGPKNAATKALNNAVHKKHGPVGQVGHNIHKDIQNIPGQVRKALPTMDKANKVIPVVGDVLTTGGPLLVGASPLLGPAGPVAACVGGAMTCVGVGIKSAGPLMNAVNKLGHTIAEPKGKVPSANAASANAANKNKKRSWKRRLEVEY